MPPNTGGTGPYQPQSVSSKPIRKLPFETKELNKERYAAFRGIIKRKALQAVQEDMKVLRDVPMDKYDGEALYSGCIGLGLIEVALFVWFGITGNYYTTEYRGLTEQQAEISKNFLLFFYQHRRLPFSP